MIGNKDIQPDKIKNVWIYGAGNIGRMVMKRLVNSGISVNGFVVTNTDENEATIDGHSVISIDNVSTNNDNTLFIIGVYKTHHDEIREIINTNGYTNVIGWEADNYELVWQLAEYKFIDRKRNAEKVCFILGGYKEFLWQHVFERLIKYIPDDVEVCLLSSGIYSDKLSGIAEKNQWSYLSTPINSVTLIQNIAYSLYEDATWIYKMDEDMFLTEDCFDRLLGAYELVKNNEPYNVGFSAPLIPLNGYGYIRLLKKLDLYNEYEKRFDSPLFGCHPDKKLEADVEAAKFMWGADETVPYIDELNRMFANSGEYSYCNVRFSIGFILFARELWIDMGCFDVVDSSALGIDEEEICKYCMDKALALVVAENSVVGHFSFGQQTAKMKEFYEADRRPFEIHD